MIRRCAWCGRDQGVKPPLGNRAVTHTICPACLRRLTGAAVPGRKTDLAPARRLAPGAGAK